jgi:hypothetical protein
MNEGAMPPVRFEFRSEGAHTDLIPANVEYSDALCVPVVQVEKPHGRKLAVVGSGPSLKHSIKTLKKWKGEIWAINGTAGYLLDHGIESTLFSVDPGPRFDLSRVSCAKDALISAACDPALFDAYAGRVKRFFLDENPQAPFAVTGGATTATRAPMLGIHMGYRDITYFGCEGSYNDSTHVYQDRKNECELWIEAGGKRYRTDPESIMQCQYLSSLITAFPHGFAEKCGGLLRAMLHYPDTWSMVAVSEAMKNRLEASIASQQGVDHGRNHACAG